MYNKSECSYFSKPTMFQVVSIKCDEHFDGDYNVTLYSVHTKSKIAFYNGIIPHLYTLSNHDHFIVVF